MHDKLIAGLSAAHAGFHHRGFTVYIELVLAGSLSMHQQQVDTSYIYISQEALNHASTTN